MEIFIKHNLRKINLTVAVTTILFLLAFGGFVLGQAKSEKEEDCKNKEKTAKELKSKTSVEQFVRAGISSNRLETGSKVLNFSNIRAFRGNYVDERSISVNPKVFVSLCVLRGSIRVSGWNRSEVRVFVRNNKKNQIGFKVRERERVKKQPVWVEVLGYNPDQDTETSDSTCLSGEIELDVPRDASITIENSKGESETTIDSVRSAKVEVLGGDIYLNNVSDRIDAQTYQGGVTVRNSSGKMSLATTTGNIIAYNTQSSEIGDYFKAKTRSGAITLQSVGQKDVESSSISGSISYIGKISSYGRYGFNTTKGSINLAIPADSSCLIVAAYGGAFQSELPLADIVKERTESLVFLKAKIGAGEANLNLKSFYGTISILERKEPVLAEF